MFGRLAPVLMRLCAQDEDADVLLGATGARGYPLRSFLDVGKGHDLYRLLSHVIPPVTYFMTLEENMLLCNRTELAGATLASLQLGHTLDSALLRRWLDFGDGVLRNCASVCPQLAMAGLLLFIHSVLQLPLQADLRLAGNMHLRYGILKQWLLDLFPERSPLEVLTGWLQGLEARVFATYYGAQSVAYNVLEGPRPLGGALSAALFQQQCPEASLSATIAVVELPAPLGGNESQSSSFCIQGPVPVSLTIVGNALSVYWQARGLAQLAGSCFEAASGMASADFVRFLPRRASATRGDLGALQRSCSACWLQAHWRWPHLCLGPWSQSRGLIREGIRRALKLSGAAHRALRILRPHDVVIHLRCVPMFYTEYPLSAFSHYAALPASVSGSPLLRFVIVAGTLGPSCGAVALALTSFLHSHYPQAAVLHQFTTTHVRGVMTEDLVASQVSANTSAVTAELHFALLTFAPVLFRTPGSFSLWAGLAHKLPQLVISTENPAQSEWAWQTADFGSDWIWTPAPLLTEATAAAKGFSFESPEPWIDWLRSH